MSKDAFLALFKVVNASKTEAGCPFCNSTTGVFNKNDTFFQKVRLCSFCLRMRVKMHFGYYLRLEVRLQQ